MEKGSEPPFLSAGGSDSWGDDAIQGSGTHSGGMRHRGIQLSKKTKMQSRSCAAASRHLTPMETPTAQSTPSIPRPTAAKPKHPRVSVSAVGKPLLVQAKGS